MGKLFKLFAEWVTRWELRLQRDEFLVTRIRLTALYTALAVFFLISFSYVLQWGLISRLAGSAEETISDPSIRIIVLQRAEGIIENFILLGDLIVLITIIIVGFFLTRKTLEPIQSMMKKQDRFLADASHELRTPLAVMKTGVEVTLRRKELSLSDARQELSNVLDEVNIMTSLSDDLLVISRSNLTTKNFGNIFLPILLKKTISRLEPVAKEKNISLLLSGTVDGNKHIVGNESMIMRVFYNLIYNAISYTNLDGTVKINFLVKNNKYIVNIIDTGIGISKESLPYIFEPFYRAENSHTKSGSGLGLSIVKSSVEFHNGSISVKSEEGKGTEFTVELPIAS